jgi:hypothetical protein
LVERIRASEKLILATRGAVETLALRETPPRPVTADKAFIAGETSQLRKDVKKETPILVAGSAHLAGSVLASDQRLRPH